MNRFIFTALFLFAATFAAVAGNENEYEDSDYVKYMGKADTAIIAGDWQGRVNEPHAWPRNRPKCLATGPKC